MHLINFLSLHFLLLCELWQQARAALPHHIKKELNTEQHLIIDWTRFYTEDHLTSILESHGLEVEQVIPVQPISEEYRLNILGAFYKAIVQNDSVRGVYPFVMYLVRDRHPRYEYRMAGVRGLHQVNVNVHNVKQELRKLVAVMPTYLATSLGQGFHTSDHISETKSNLKALGFYETLYKKRKFRDMSEVFEALNSVASLTYVVLRNFEK
jgi:hypothetical protein